MCFSSANRKIGNLCLKVEWLVVPKWEREKVVEVWKRSLLGKEFYLWSSWLKLEGIIYNFF